MVLWVLAFSVRLGGKSENVVIIGVELSVDLDKVWESDRRGNVFEIGLAGIIVLGSWINEHDFTLVIVAVFDLEYVDFVLLSFTIWWELNLTCGGLNPGGGGIIIDIAFFWSSVCNKGMCVLEIRAVENTDVDVVDVNDCVTEVNVLVLLNGLLPTEVKRDREIKL